MVEIRNPLLGKTNTIEIPVIEKTIENEATYKYYNWVRLNHGELNENINT